MNKIREFIFDKQPRCKQSSTAISLFSAVGLSDLGYSRSGFNFLLHAEALPYRACVGQDNWPESHWIVGDVSTKASEIIKVVKAKSTAPLDLLVATPPCQGMSSSNPTRGKRSTAEAEKHHDKNKLLLSIVPIAKALKPRFIVAENVRQLITQPLEGESCSIVEKFEAALKRQYVIYKSVIDVADYGVPQGRKRSIIVAVRADEACLPALNHAQVFPWPKATHGTDLIPHVNVRAWMEYMEYDPLDSRSPDTARSTHPLHSVPVYQGDRYLQISSIPPHSGKSAYENDECPDCGHHPIEIGLVRCPECANLLRNRPYVYLKGSAPRLISGFKSSYRRMASEKPAATISTGSSHVGSDYKIHPFEHRVLSALECADLQTIPRSYNWKRTFVDRRSYLVRQAIGEAFPPYFTYLHGSLLKQLLNNSMSKLQMKRHLASRSATS